MEVLIHGPCDRGFGLVVERIVLAHRRPRFDPDDLYSFGCIPQRRELSCDYVHYIKALILFSLTKLSTMLNDTGPLIRVPMCVLFTL
jgi:hypothetical protein